MGGAVSCRSGAGAPCGRHRWYGGGFCLDFVFCFGVRTLPACFWSDDIVFMRQSAYVCVQPLAARVQMLMLHCTVTSAPQALVGTRTGALASVNVRQEPSALFCVQLLLLLAPGIGRS